MARLIAALAAGLWLSLTAADAMDMGEAALSLPEGWQPVNRDADRWADFAGPDGVSLSVRWWFPDEPLTGGEGVSFAARPFPAGPALVLTSGGAGLNRVMVAFDHRNAGGEILLLTAEGPGPAEALHGLLLPIAETVRFGGTPAEQPPATGAQDAALFAGVPSPAWELHLARKGQAEWTRYEGGSFIAEVPAGPDYRATGLRTVEPVVRLPGASDGFATRIAIDMDTDRLDNVVIALVQTGQQGKLDWDNHEIWLGVEHHPDKVPELILAVQGQVTRRLALPDASALAGLVLEMRPDGLIRVSNGAGAVLVEGTMAPVPTPGPYHLQVSATAPRGDVPAFLALRQVRLEERAVDPALDPGLLLAGTPLETLLFDGQGPGAQMALHGPRGMDPAAVRFAGGLFVQAPAAALQGIGLYSVDPVVWLDRFGPGASLRLRLEFDPAATTGVEVALAAPMSNADNEPGTPGLRLHWRRLGEEHFLTRTVDGGTPRNAAIPGMPASVDVVLRPDGVQMLAEGFPDDVLPWPLLQDGAGLRLFVLARGDHESQPAAMGLRRITLLRTPGAAIPAPSPAPGVSALPEAAFFPAAGWEGYGLAGVDFAAVGGLAADGSVAVDVPEGNSGGRAGVLSPQPVAVLDHRLERTGYRLALAFDPARTDGFEVILSQDRQAGMEQGSEVVLGLVRQPAGARSAGDWLLSATGGHYKYWTRRIPAAAMAGWDGRFEVILTQGTLRVDLPGITGLLVPDIPALQPGVSLYASVHSRSALPYGAAKMALRAATGGWITPAGMTDRARLVLLGPDGFDPEAWVGLLRGELEEQVR